MHPLLTLDSVEGRPFLELWDRLTCFQTRNQPHTPQTHSKLLLQSQPTSSPSVWQTPLQTLPSKERIPFTSRVCSA